MSLYEDLAEYTSRNPDLVRWRCKIAAIELAWEWEKYKDDPLAFYRESDLYIFDLTEYQSRLNEVGIHQWFVEKIMNNQWKTMLDYGGGIGEYTLIASKLGIKVDFLEVAGSKTLDYAKWRFNKYDIRPTIFDENHKIDKKYDLIIAMDVLEHMSSPQPLIKDFASHSEFIMANPDQIVYNALYPQHISKYSLTDYFSLEERLLWKRKKSS